MRKISEANTNVSPKRGLRPDDRMRSQYRYNTGIPIISLNIESHRTSHPAEPKASEMPSEITQNRKAFPKQMKNISLGSEIKTANADKRKGKAVTLSRSTIDTAP